MVTIALNEEAIARDVIVIGASAGGVSAVIELLSRVPSDITAFLMEWLADVPDGDPLALTRFIWQEHPGYAADPLMTRAEIQSRIAALSRAHRGDDRPRGHRIRERRVTEL